MRQSAAAFLGALLCATCVGSAPQDNQRQMPSVEPFERDVSYANLSILVGQYECFTKALETVSQSNGLEDLVALSRSQFAANIVKWKKCGEAQSYMGLICHSRQAYNAYGLVNDYVAVASEKVANFKTLLSTKYLTQCILPISIRLIGDNAIDQITAKCRCVIAVFDEAIGPTKHTALWTQYEQQLNQTIRDCDNCKQSPGIEKAKCVWVESLEFVDLATEFFYELSKVDEEIIQQIYPNILQNCGYQSSNNQSSLELSDSSIEIYYKHNNRL